MVVTERRAAGADRPLDPRLGPRLLLRRRREQHLRQALQPAVRQPAARLRPQVRLQPPRLQPEGHRHAGGDRLRPARAARRLRRRPQAQPRRGCSRRCGRYEDRLLLPVAPPDTDPSWFGSSITVREDAGFTRRRPDRLPRGQPRSRRAACSAATCCATRRSRRSSAGSSATSTNTDVGHEPTRSSSASTRASTTPRLDYMVDVFARFMAGERGRPTGSTAPRTLSRVAVVRRIACVVATVDRPRRARLHRRRSSRDARCRGSSPGSSCTWRSTRTTARLLAGVAGVLDRQLAATSAIGLTITYAVKGAFTTRMERELALGGQRLGQAAVRRVRRSTRQGRRAVRRRHGVTAFTAFLESLTPDHRPRRRALLRRPDAGPVRLRPARAEACAARSPSLTCHLVCEATHGRLEVDAAWPAIDALRRPALLPERPAADARGAHRSAARPRRSRRGRSGPMPGSSARPLPERDLEHVLEHTRTSGTTSAAVDCS